MHACIHTYINTYIHACMHTYIHLLDYNKMVTLRGAYMQTCMHACIYTYMHTRIHPYIHTYIHAYIYTYLHTYIRTYIQTNIHLHDYIKMLPLRGASPANIFISHALNVIKSWGLRSMFNVVSVGYRSASEQSNVRMSSSNVRSGEWQLRTVKLRMAGCHNNGAEQCGENLPTTCFKH